MSSFLVPGGRWNATKVANRSGWEDSAGHHIVSVKKFLGECFTNIQ
jgi:hypothetical protein